MNKNILTSMPAAHTCVECRLPPARYELKYVIGHTLDFFMISMFCEDLIDSVNRIQKFTNGKIMI